MYCLNLSIFIITILMPRTKTKKQKAKGLRSGSMFAKYNYFLIRGKPPVAQKLRK